jgi:hypothetical protein
MTIYASPEDAFGLSAQQTNNIRDGSPEQKFSLTFRMRL